MSNHHTDHDKGPGQARTQDSASDQPTPADPAPAGHEARVKKRVILALAALVMAMVVGTLLVFWFANSERKRDILAMQARMTVIADSRAEAVGTWLDRQYEVLAGLARNQSLQIYVNVIEAEREAAAGPSEEEAAQITYLRTLLEATARQSGFAPDAADTTLRANVRETGTSGLALVTPEAEALAASADMPPVAGVLRAALDALPQTERGLVDLHLAPNGALRLGLIVPVFGPQVGDATPGVIARILGLRSVGRGFFDTLVQPGETVDSAESYLIRRENNAVVYLTPLRDDTPPLKKRLDLASTPDLVDAMALSEPGGFHAGTDYAATDAFAVSRAIAGTDWVLVHRLDQKEALAASEQRLATLVTVLLLALVLVGVALVAVWRYGTSVRAQEAAARFRASSERFESLSQFLDVVTDTQPQPLFVTTEDNVLTFANRRAGEIMGVPKTDVPGRALLAMLGRDRGTLYAEINRAVLESNQARTETTHLADDAGEEIVWRSTHCPLTLTEDSGPSQRAVLTSIEDLTEQYRERARREHTTRQLIQTLVGLVDERDPDSADQSRNVAVVARTIAEEMALEPDLIEATDQAARLVNIGKIRVPRALLTKQSGLTDEEKAQIRDALDSGPEILKGIDFGAPVVETLAQINERADGTGRPQSLPGDQILPSAQAVALANTFVALVSPRAFREGKTFDQAEEILMSEVNKRFDRRPVLSLLNYLNNKGGREAWAHMGNRR